MLSVEVKINERVIARMTARNLSSLADFSDYDVEVWEDGRAPNGHPEDSHRFKIKGYARRASCFVLIAKILHYVGVRRYQETLGGQPTEVFECN